jgi:hypothetical protein
MRWPRVARNSIETDLDVSRKDSNDNDNATQDTLYDHLTLKSAIQSGSGLSQMFSDAALYEKVLSACPETLKNGVFPFSADDESLPNCLGGFNQLIGCDLDDAERAITGKLATLSVNNWTPSTDDPFGADTPSEEEPGEISSSDEGEDKKQAPLSAAPTSSDSEELSSEPKLTPEEVVELFELEFGALAAPGEEKLLLETDAALLRDVIVLVGPPTPSPFTDSPPIYIFPLLFRALFTSLHIDSRFMLLSYLPSRAIPKTSSSPAQPYVTARDGVEKGRSGCNWTMTWSALSHPAVMRTESSL